MTEAEGRLLALLKERSFQFGDFKLSSGERSSYYIDGRMSATFSASAHLIGEVLYQRTCERGIDAIGGLAVGAVAPVAAAVISYHLHGRTMEGFYVRDRQKDHGTRKRIEGKLEKGWRVAVVDDVLTTGGSAVQAIEAVEEAGAQVAVVIAIVDRLQGARELLASRGITHYEPVFTIRDFGVKA